MCFHHDFSQNIAENDPVFPDHDVIFNYMLFYYFNGGCRSKNDGVTSIFIYILLW